jgi:hypothetical protein
MTPGRWRLSGRVLIAETGPAALAPVGTIQSFVERFDGPLVGNEVSKFRIVSADEAGLVLDIGGMERVFTRGKEGGR